MEDREDANERGAVAGGVNFEEVVHSKCPNQGMEDTFSLRQESWKRKQVVVKVNV